MGDNRRLGVFRECLLVIGPSHRRLGITWLSFSTRTVGTCVDFAGRGAITVVLHGSCKHFLYISRQPATLLIPHEVYGWPISSRVVVGGGQSTSKQSYQGIFRISWMSLRFSSVTTRGAQGLISHYAISARSHVEQLYSHPLMR
jgi:hypothetical protein